LDVIEKLCRIVGVPLRANTSVRKERTKLEKGITNQIARTSKLIKKMDQAKYPTPKHVRHYLLSGACGVARHSRLEGIGGPI
jgi:ribosomal protein L32E